MSNSKSPEDSFLDKLRRPSPTRRFALLVLAAAAMTLCLAPEAVERGSLLWWVMKGLWILGCVLAGAGVAYVCILFIKKNCGSDPQRMAAEARSCSVTFAKLSVGIILLSIILSLALWYWRKGGNESMDWIMIGPINLMFWVPIPLLWLWARRTEQNQHSNTKSTPKTSSSDN